MSSARVRRCVAGFVPAALAVLALAEPAAAVLEGRNGRIAFTSGREGVNDNLAQLYLRAAIGSTGSGPLSPPFSQAGVQNRHPSWSPDRTKVVFAAGTPGAPTTEEFDLFVKDFETGQTTPLDLLEINDGLSSDHPAWSPDGTRIAYEKQTADNSPQRDIMVKTFGSGQPAVALTTGGPVEFKPAWSPDSRTIYYARTNPAPANDHDIVRRDANGGGLSQILFTPVDEYQPAISPDGTKLCYTRQITVGNAATAEIVVAPLADPGAGFELSSDPAKGDINCTWSPDGRKIAYTNGVFSQGRLVMENADNSSPEPVLLEDDTGSNNFDGNADWAPDGSPDCPDRSVTTTPGTAVTIEIECTDTGPAYERTDPSGFVKGRPAHGEISDESPTSNPSTVRYTPAPGFTGTDTLSLLRVRRLRVRHGRRDGDDHRRGAGRRRRRAGWRRGRPGRRRSRRRRHAHVRREAGDDRGHAPCRHAARDAAGRRHRRPRRQRPRARRRRRRPHLRRPRRGPARGRPRPRPDRRRRGPRPLPQRRQAPL